MTPKKSEFRNYLDSTQSLPPDCVLGNIVWFGVEDRPHDAVKAHDMFDKLGLNTALLPQPVRAIDAFKKACTEVNGFKYDMDNGEYAEVLVRKVTDSPEMLVRHLVRERRDDTKRKLGYERAADITFYREVFSPGTQRIQQGSFRLRQTINRASLYPEEVPIIEGVLADLQAKFYQHINYYDGPKIRGIIRDYLKYLNAVMMKPSVYFVHSTRTPELLGLQEFVRAMDCTMSLLPLVDLKTQREEVIEAFQTEAENDLSSLVQHIARLRSERKTITTESYVKLKKEYERVLARSSEYSRVLKVRQTRTAGAAELALDSLLAFENDMKKQLEGTP